MATNKPDFESTYGAPFRAVHRRFGSKTPASAVRRHPEPTVVAQPLAYLNVQVDGRETSYFEWLGSGIYSTDLRGSILNVQPHFLHELHFGFGDRFFYLRVNAFPEMLPKLQDCEFRIALRGSNELRLMVVIEKGNFAGCLLDMEDVCILGLHELVEVAFDKILEVGIGRRLIALMGQTSFTLEVALWRGGLPADVLPRASSLQVRLGTDAFAWPVQ
jgi:hypothetical protein